MIDEKKGALSGIRVIDLGRMVAAPYCAMMLANMGAEVIKVEEPEGGDISRVNLPKQNGISTYYIAYNCSKSGITLNLKSSEGKAILRKLIQNADVLIENFRPGVMERLGFDYRAVSKINPRIVYASISGYGQEGEMSERAAFDPIAQAVSGMVSITGTDVESTVRCGASIADILAGQNAAFAILSALFYRNSSGRGQHIDIALADSCVAAMASVIQIYLTTGKVPSPLGNGFEASAPGNAYRTKNGRIMLLAGRNSEWAKLAKTLGHPEWLEDDLFTDVADRVRNRNQLDVMIEAETQKYTTDELIQLLLDAKLPAGEILNIEQVVNSPHFCQERNMFVDVEDPIAGKVRITNLPINMSESQPHIYKCAPTLGQDNDRILSDLGYSAEEIQSYKKNNII